MGREVLPAEETGCLLTSVSRMDTCLRVSQSASMSAEIRALLLCAIAFLAEPAHALLATSGFRTVRNACSPAVYGARHPLAVRPVSVRMTEELDTTLLPFMDELLSSDEVSREASMAVAVNKWFAEGEAVADSNADDLVKALFCGDFKPNGRWLLPKKRPRAAIFFSASDRATPSPLARSS